MPVKIRLDNKGIGEVLQSAELESLVNSLADSVAGNVSISANDGPVDVETRPRVAVGDRLSARPAVDVILAHPAGMALEGKYGVLASAAAAAGLAVKRRS